MEKFEKIITNEEWIDIMTYYILYTYTNYSQPAQSYDLK